MTGWSRLAARPCSAPGVDTSSSPIDRARGQRPRRLLRPNHRHPRRLVAPRSSAEPRRGRTPPPPSGRPNRRHRLPRGTAPKSSAPRRRWRRQRRLQHPVPGTALKSSEARRQSPRPRHPRQVLATAPRSSGARRRWRRRPPPRRVLETVRKSSAPRRRSRRLRPLLRRVAPRFSERHRRQRVRRPPQALPTGHRSLEARPPLRPHLPDRLARVGRKSSVRVARLSHRGPRAQRRSSHGPPPFPRPRHLPPAGRSFSARPHLPWRRGLVRQRELTSRPARRCCKRRHPTSRPTAQPGRCFLAGPPRRRPAFGRGECHFRRNSLAFPRLRLSPV
jgi:hypothetical protein